MNTVFLKIHCIHLGRIRFLKIYNHGEENFIGKIIT